MKLVSPPPIDEKLGKLPEKKVCLDPTKTEYSVAELEAALDCYKEMTALLKKKFINYKGAVVARDQAMKKAAEEAKGVQTK